MSDKSAVDRFTPDPVIEHTHRVVGERDIAGEVYIRCETCYWTSNDVHEPTLPELHTIWNGHLRSVAVIEAGVGLAAVDADDPTKQDDQMFNRSEPGKACKPTPERVPSRSTGTRVPVEPRSQTLPIPNACGRANALVAEILAADHVIVVRRWIDTDNAHALFALNDPARTRRMDPAIWRDYADQMRRDEWAETGDTLKFNQSGYLIDGQHRLQAVIAAHWSGWMHIAYNVNDNAAHVMTPPGQP